MESKHEFSSEKHWLSSQEASEGVMMNPIFKPISPREHTFGFSTCYFPV